MKQVNWEVVLGQIDDIYIQEAFSTQTPYHQSHRAVPRKILVLAAVIALLFALSVTAYAADWFGIQSMSILLPKSQHQVVLATGFGDSVEFQASAEWLDYRTTLLGVRRLANLKDVDKAHRGYWCFNLQDVEMLDAITEKYGLQLHQSFVTIRDFCQEDLYEAVGVSGFLPPSIDPEPRGGGHVRDGITIVSYEDRAELPNGKSFGYGLDISAKGYLNGCWWLETDVSTLTEWTYTTAGGTEVVLCQDENHNFLLLDMDHSFLFLSAQPIDDTWTPADLEAFAELFDFEKMNSIGSQP